MKESKEERAKRKEGFTLIEVIISIVIFGLLSWGIIYLVANVFVSSTKQGTLLADADQARRTVFQITSELRNSQTSSTGAYALDTAQDQQIIFYSNIDGGSDIERVRYFIQNGKLMRGVVKPSGSPLAYNLASETTSAVQANLGNGTNPLFYYYDGSYGGTGSALSQPVNATSIKFVKVNLIVANKGGKANSGAFTVTAGAAIRSVKTNLGS